MTWLVAFCAASGIALALNGISSPRRRRLSLRVDPYLSGLHGAPSRLLTHRSRRDGLWSAIEAHVRRYLPYRSEDLAARMRAAGDDRSPEDLRIEQLLWALAGAVTVITVVGTFALSTGSVDVRSLPALVVIAAVGGYLGRDWWLGRQIRARRDLIAAELPVALDLVALAIMAGESVLAAFERVARHLGEGLGTEFRTVVGDVRTGTPVVEAIERLSTRVPSPGMARFVDSLCTGIERGAPLAEVLRGQADDARATRRRDLLELGGKKEVVMLVPVVFLIMPVVVVFALFPGLVSLNLLVP